MSTRKETMINLGLISNKTCISLSTCYDSPVTRGKRGNKVCTKSQVSEHTAKVYSNLSCCIHADVNKRQITRGKNSPDKIEERRRNIPQIINLRFGVRTLLLNPKVWRKAGRIYRWRTVFSPSAIQKKNFFAPSFYLNCFSLFLSFI